MERVWVRKLRPKPVFSFQTQLEKKSERFASPLSDFSQQVNPFWLCSTNK
jgi:hypothetical protein